MYLTGPGRRCDCGPTAEVGPVRDSAGGFYPATPNAALLCPVPFPASRSPGQQGHPRAWCSALSVCPCRAAVPFSCPLLGTSPCATSWQPLLPLQPRPARTVRAFGSASRGLCSRGVGLGSAAQMKPVSWQGHGKALGSFPVQNNARGVCRLQSFPRSVVPGCWTWRLPAVGAA